ncbi:uncharacterized protein N7496_009343 [Penicillium cataractarum]|uniref:DUF6604 domain-containing protein n=1 Tax=Penicillium cataractarum TaxID=2100454 RepID=A0A9W9RQ66_9EURO|nr:uncharacterized protein N7496_009343 [Penicillium cataractarum]KAJ5363630.1 hypothetical protein N7496_009343 [Penicillium cataractarum]
MDVSEEDTVQFTVTVKDLQNLAEVVAGSALTVPQSILAIAKRAIKLRKTVTSWFLGHGDSENNKRHTHFITVLEQICETLEWKTNGASESDAKQSTSTSGAERDDADTSEFMNRFAVLTVEEPREFAQTEPTYAGTKKIVKVDIDEEDDQAESYPGQSFFKTLCLFRDLQNMRKFITQTWSEYRERKIDLMNASIVTDSALQLAKHLADKVEAEWHTSGLLKSDDVQKLNEDKTIFLSLLPEFCTANTFRVEIPAQDMVTRGLVEFAKTKKVPLWLSFASQIFLDVHHTMRYGPLGALEDLRMSGLRIEKTVKDYMQLTKSHPQPQFWPKMGDAELQAIGMVVKLWIIEDEFLEMRARSASFGGLPAPDKHALFSGHSIFCGLILFHLHMRLQSIGKQLVTQGYDVQQLAFLHNLVIQSPMYKNVKWPDMDTFVKIHGGSHIFIGFSSATRFTRDSRKKDAGIGNIDRVLDELFKKSNLENCSKKRHRSKRKSIASRQGFNFHNIVASAGDVMRDYLRKNGGVACKELRVFCKNKKPIHDDPDYDKGKEGDEPFYSWPNVEDILDPKLVASLQTGIPIA